MTDDAIDVNHLVKRYGDVIALQDFSVRVARGEIFGFLGQNGAGKTTAIKMLLGLIRPTAGDGTVMQRPLGSRRARSAVGYLPELFRYQSWLTGREVLRFHASLIGLKQACKTIEDVLHTVGIAAAASRRVGTYSKGMQQRLGLGVAILGDPRLIFLDEPTSALDPAGRADVRLLLRSLKARGISVFLNSHLLSEVEQVCDRVAIVRMGTIVAGGTLTDLLGSTRAIRIRAAPNGTPLRDVLGRFGRLSVDDTGAFTIHGAAGDETPAIVAALVAANASIYAVEPLTATLEERFLEITR